MLAAWCFQVQMRMVCLFEVRAGNCMSRGGSAVRMLKQKEVKWFPSSSPSGHALLHQNTQRSRSAVRSLPSSSLARSGGAEKPLLSCGSDALSFEGR